MGTDAGPPPLEPLRSAGRLLDPPSRISEVLFGLIMALTFTGSLGAASAGREEVRTMLIGAVGCNIAWGLIDAVMYVVSQLTERGRNLQTVRELRASADPAAARRIIADAMPPAVARLLPDASLEEVRVGLERLGELPARPRLHRSDLVGAAGVFLLVFLATFPVVVPFIFMPDATAGLRVSNGIAVVMLFVCGYRLGSYSGNGAWRWGLSTAVAGMALVALTIALGG